MMKYLFKIKCFNFRDFIVIAVNANFANNVI